MDIPAVGDVISMMASRKWVLTCFRSMHLLLQKKVKSAYAIMPMEMGSSMRTIACVVLLVTGPDPACFASFSDSTEKLASAVVMPPIVMAMCIQARNVLSLAADK